MVAYRPTNAGPWSLPIALGASNSQVPGAGRTQRGSLVTPNEFDRYAAEAQQLADYYREQMYLWAEKHIWNQEEGEPDASEEA